MGFISIFLILGSLAMILGDPLRADDCDDKCEAGSSCCCGIILLKAGGVGVGGSCVLPLSVFQSLGIPLINNCACVEDEDINTCDGSNEDCPEGQKCCCDGGQVGEPRAPGSNPCSQAPARVPELGIVKGPRACHCVDECKKDSDCPVPQLCCCDNHGGYYKRYPEFEGFCPGSPQASPKYLTKSGNCQCMYSQSPSRITNGTDY